MPDPDGNTKAGESTLPETPLHAYKEGREEDIKGDTEKLSSDDPKDLRASEIEDDDEPQVPKK
jgi:hypothetical protein